MRTDLVNSHKKIREYERVIKKGEKEMEASKKVSNADIFARFMQKNKGQN